MLCVYDTVYAEHLAGIAHPESPRRAEAVASLLDAHGKMNARVNARDATDEEIARVHGAAYPKLVERETARLHGTAAYLSTGDTVVDERSLAVARRAAGGAIVAAQTAFERNTGVFAIVRPPGHHAESTRGMGFCVFNNLAIAARAVQASTGARILAIDFDYHHGNGTQALSGNGLSYASSHGYPAYPGTGGPDENYALPDGDAIVNIPLPAHGFGTEAFVALWESLLPQLAQTLRPDMLLVSAGFDYVKGDPVGDLGVEEWAAARLAAAIDRVAREHCNGRVAYMLEGGYDCAALARSVEMVMDQHDAGYADASEAEVDAIPDRQRALLDRAAELLKTV